MARATSWAPSVPSYGLVSTSSTPKERRICLRSFEAFSGTHNVTGMPAAAAKMA